VGANSNAGINTPIPGDGDFVSPTNTATAAALDGNTDANKRTITVTVPVTIPSGSTVAIRFIDYNATGNDDGLAIDDFSFTSGGAPTATATPAPTPTAGPAATATPAPTSTPIPTATPVGTPAPTSTLVISEVYGGGGNAGATLSNDFIELYNAGSTPVVLDGFSVQYAGATVAFGNGAGSITPLTGTIQPGSFYLVQEAAGANTNAAPLPTPNATGTIAIGAANGKVALVRNTDPITGATDTDVVDFVGFGSANQFETAPAPAASNTTSVSRTSPFIDTNDNSADFRSQTPAPQSSPVTASGPTAYAIAGTSLYRFNTGSPSAPALVGDTGIAFAGIDFNPANGQLYGLSIGSNVQLYIINTSTGAATPIGSGFSLTGSGSNGATPPVFSNYDLTGQNIGFDFNPKTLQGDGSIRIRVTAQNGSNLRLNSATGFVANVDIPLNGAATSSVGSAYTNNVAQLATAGGTTTLYDVSDSTDALYIQNPPNNGVLTLVGSTLGIDVKAATGFDIFTDSTGTGNSAFLATDADGTPGTEFFTVDLGTGVATAAGNFGSLGVSDIAVQTLGSANGTSSPTTGALISEYRFSGAAGATDEFIELVNTTTSSLDVTGWTVMAGGTTITLTKPLPARGHLLVTGAGYSLSDYGGTGLAAGDVSYSTDIPVGTTLTLTNSAGGTVDTATNSTFTALIPAANSQYSFVRRLDLNTGLPTDSGTDASDFNLVEVNSTSSGPADSTDSSTSNGKLRLGAPGPQNRTSPVIRILTYGTFSSNASENTLRDNTSGAGGAPFGTLSLRRTITNSTTAPITRLRLRVTNITAGTPTGGNGVADVRLLDSTTTSVNGVNLNPTVVEKSTGATTGVLNSTLLITLPAPLAVGDSVKIELLFGVFTKGSYRLAGFFEVLP
jgi:hypothetical protein